MTAHQGSDQGRVMPGAPGFIHNRTAAKLAAGEPALGTLSMLGDPNVIEAIGQAGMDFVWLDMEHTERDMSQIVQLIRAASLTGVTPFVRVPSLDVKEIQRALDAGAEAIVVPTVRTGEEARLLANATKYPPLGIRGTCRYSRAGAAGRYAQQWQDFTANANAQILSMALVEDLSGVEHLEEIVAAVDIVLIGRGDLSTALGVPGQVNHPKVTAVVERYEAVAKALGKPLATMCYTAQEAQSAVERGYTFLMYGADINEIYRAYSSFREEFVATRRPETVDAAS